MTKALTMSEAATELRKSRRWLQDWLRDHPVDRYGVPFYSPLGRAKLFGEADLNRILETAREEERCRLNSSRRLRDVGRRTTQSAAPTSASTLKDLRALLTGTSPRRSSKKSNDQSN